MSNSYPTLKLVSVQQLSMSHIPLRYTENARSYVLQVSVTLLNLFLKSLPFGKVPVTDLVAIMRKLEQNNPHYKLL